MTLWKPDGRVTHAMPKDPALIELLAYRNELRGDRRAPMRRDLDPAKLAHGPSPTLISGIRHGTMTIGRALESAVDTLAAVGRRA